MAKSYLHSDKVKVFPYGNYRPTEPTSRLLNEENLSKLVQALTDKNGYVVKHDDDYKYDFVLGGYYFSIDLSDIDLEVDKNTPVYAVIDFMQHDKNGSRILEGGDNVGIVDGSGTVKDPYKLSPGIVRIKIQTTEEIYFEYSFTESGQTITIVNRDTFTFKPVTDDNIRTNETKITCINPCTCTFVGQLANNLTEGYVVLDVVVDGRFTGLHIVTEQPAEDACYIQLSGRNCDHNTDRYNFEASIRNNKHSIDYNSSRLSIIENIFNGNVLIDLECGGAQEAKKQVENI